MQLGQDWLFCTSITQFVLALLAGGSVLPAHHSRLALHPLSVSLCARPVFPGIPNLTAVASSFSSTFPSEPTITSCVPAGPSLWPQAFPGTQIFLPQRP